MGIHLVTLATAYAAEHDTQARRQGEQSSRAPTLFPLPGFPEERSGLRSTSSCAEIVKFQQNQRSLQTPAQSNAIKLVVLLHAANFIRHTSPVALRERVSQ